MGPVGAVCMLILGGGMEGTFPSGWGFPLVGEVVARPDGHPISRLFLHVDEEALRRALRGAVEPRGEAAYRLLERGGIRFVLVQKRLEDLGPRARRDMMLTMLRPHFPPERWMPEEGDLARFLAWGERASNVAEVVVMLVDAGRAWEIVQAGRTVLRVTDPLLLQALFQVYLGPRPGEPGNRAVVVRMLDAFTGAIPERGPAPH